MQRLISAILSFIVSFLSMFGVDIPPEAIWRTEGSAVSTETAIEVPSLPENLVMYCEEVVEEDISVLPGSGMHYAARDLLVQMDSEVTEEEARALAQEYGADLVGFINLTGTCQWRFPGDADRDMLLALQEEVEALPGIACASLNYLFDDEGQGGSPLSDSVPQETASKKADKLWGFNQSHGEFAWEHRDWMKEPVSVAVLDMGFQDHDKLQYKLLHLGSGEDRVHGTHVMGIIGAARRKKKEVCGIYPEAAGRMYAYDISNASMIEHVVEIVDAVTRGIKVLNISVGYSKEKGFHLNAAEKTESIIPEVEQQTRLYEKVLEQLIDEEYEFLLVIAAGNESSRKKHWNGSTFFTPDGKVKELSLKEEMKLKQGASPESIGLCAYQVMQPEVSHPALRISKEKVAKRIVCVSAYNQKVEMLGMANMGERVDILAPGFNIYSTCNYTKQGAFQKQKTEGALSGTSMAAPYVSGALACIWSMNSSLSAETVRNILIHSCDTWIQDSASPYSGRVLNVENAMNAMKGYLNADTEQWGWGLTEWLIGDDEHRTGEGEADEDVRKVPVKIVVKDGVSNVEIEKFEVEVKNGQGEVQKFTQDWTNENEERSDFEQRMENSVFYLDPGEYTVRVYAQGYEVLPQDGWKAVEDGGLQTWEFYLQPDQEVIKDALQRYLEEEILGNYPVLSTETLYGSGASGWTERDLNGVLSADIQDFDRDGQPELLIVRVETSRQEKDGASLDVWHFSLNSSFYLEMYEGYPLEKSGAAEGFPMQVFLSDAKELPVYIGYLPWGVPLLQTGIFSYVGNGKTYLAVDNNFRYSDEITTLDLFSYDGVMFEFEHAFGYQEDRQGNVYVKEALQEPQFLTCCENYDVAKSAGWEILHGYEIADHNYEPLSREAELPLMAAYQETLREYGLFANDIRLRVNQEVQADDRYYTVTTPDIYTAETEIKFLSGIYTIYHRNQPTELWRKDYQGSLDAWR